MRDTSFDNWTVQLRKGILEFCVLSAMESEAEEEVLGLWAGDGLAPADFRRSPGLYHPIWTGE